MIEVRDLQKAFGSIRAVDGISFSVARGEVVGLLGPNGAGKTTTMRLITGYLAADSGAVTVDDIAVDAFGIDARRRIGYLPENAPLYDDIEVVEHLEYISRLHGIPNRDRDEGVREMVATCGLSPVVGRRIGALSKGFRQRVGLAAALIHHPPVLVLDEPTSGLDPNQIVEIRELIRRIGCSRTVILSTHILQEVEATCSRAIIMHRGKLVGEGTIAELRSHKLAREHYTVTAHATREQLQAECPKLPKLAVSAWLSEPAEQHQRFILEGPGDGDRAEEIFRWAVANNILLSELRREGASLEQVFRELTQM
jgi:ABC-2 type transport system ATP-binding protein